MEQRSRLHRPAERDALIALPESQSKEVLQMEGRMIERLHAEMAERTLALAEAVNSP